MSEVFDLDAYDADSFTAGIWFTIKGETRVKIAQAGNTEYKKARRRLEKEFRKAHGNELTPEQELSLNCQAIAEGLLKDWQNMNLGGKDCPYSVQKATYGLKNNPKLLGFVLEKSNDLEAWERQDVEEQAEKPSGSSGGGASGSKPTSKTPTKSTAE